MTTAERVAQLEGQIQQQELLITALTSSLEQTANELDRARHSRIGEAPIVPAEESLPLEVLPVVVEEQQALVQELRGCLQQWQEMQTSLTMERMEGELHEIRDLVQELAQSGSLPSNIAPTDWKQSLTQQISSHHADPLGAILDTTIPVADDPPTETAHSTPLPSNETSEESSDEPRESKPRSTRPLVAPERMPGIPEAIAVDGATVEELRSAVQARDECIQGLLDYVQALNTVEVPEFDLKDYDALPAAERQKLEEWEAVLRENIRRAEVELSVARAQLSREQQKIQHQHVLIAKERKRLALLQKSGKLQRQVREEATNEEGHASWLNVFKWKSRDKDQDPEEPSEDE